VLLWLLLLRRPELAAEASEVMLEAVELPRLLRERRPPPGEEPAVPLPRRSWWVDSTPSNALSAPTHSFISASL
jgi:hypothetical protein